MRLLFAHGWALDRSLWDRLLPELGALANDAVILDAGYYGPKTSAPDLEDETFLGVGQSLGALELLATPPAPLAGLVALDGFARFAQAEDFCAGQDVRRLTAMARRLEHHPGELIDEFLHRSLGCVTPKHGVPDRQALAEGLNRLTLLDGRDAARTLPIWRLHAAGDPIAPVPLTDASFVNASVREREIREGCDHLSPMTAPNACADLIRLALNALQA